MPFALPPSPPALVQAAPPGRHPHPARKVKAPRAARSGAPGAPAATATRTGVTAAPVTGPALFQLPAALQAGTRLDAHLTPPMGKARLVNKKYFDGGVTVVRADSRNLDLEMKTYLWGMTGAIRIGVAGNTIRCEVEQPNSGKNVNANDHDHFDLGQPVLTPNSATFQVPQHTMLDARNKPQVIKQQELTVSWNETQLETRYNGAKLTVSLTRPAAVNPTPSSKRP